MLKPLKIRIRKILKSLRKILLSKFLFYFLLTTMLTLLFLYHYMFNSFSNVTLEQIVYGIRTADGTSETIIIDGAIFVGLHLFIFYLVFFLIKLFFNKIIKTENYLVINFSNKQTKIKLYPFSPFFNLILVVCFSGGVINYFYNQSFITDYIASLEKTSFFKEKYVHPNTVSIIAPEEKQNLIYIYVESLESSMVTSANGGAFDKKVIPNLEEIALENINFSHNDKIGGAFMPYGSSWTIAGLVASSSGVPLKIPIDNNTYYSKYGDFLSGVKSLGDILKENGYTNYFFLGSDADFGGRKNYFNTHGDYKIYDYYYAIDKGWISSDYDVWWGYEDGKLFDFAKTTLKEIADKEEPFNFTLLTTNTHFTDGYVENDCETPFDEKYLNAYYCSDKMIGDFLNWIKKQDFYKNTTIVIVGDHLTMQTNITSMFDIKNSDDYQRTIYNSFINSKAETDNSKERKFNSFDIFPTTLASLGFQIEGNKLGLGTNLFSNEKTLTEKLGYDKLNKELSLTSDFYNQFLLGNESYEKMSESIKKNNTEDDI